MVSSAYLWREGGGLRRAESVEQQWRSDALLEHFRLVAARHPDAVFTVPASTATVSSVADFFKLSSQQLRGGEPPAMRSVDPEWLAEADRESAASDSRSQDLPLSTILAFTVIRAKANTVKRVQTDPTTNITAAWP